MTWKLFLFSVDGRSKSGRRQTWGQSENSQSDRVEANGEHHGEMARHRRLNFGLIGFVDSIFIKEIGFIFVLRRIWYKYLYILKYSFIREIWKWIWKWWWLWTENFPFVSNLTFSNLAFFGYIPYVLRPRCWDYTLKLKLFILLL